MKLLVEIDFDVVNENDVVSEGYRIIDFDGCYENDNEFGLNFSDDVYSKMKDIVGDNKVGVVKKWRIK